jgi:hypothetical protein
MVCEQQVDLHTGHRPTAETASCHEAACVGVCSACQRPGYTAYGCAVLVAQGGCCVIVPVSHGIGCGLCSGDLISHIVSRRPAGEHRALHSHGGLGVSAGVRLAVTAQRQGRCRCGSCEDEVDDSALPVATLPCVLGVRCADIMVCKLQAADATPSIYQQVRLQHIVACRYTAVQHIVTCRSADLAAHQSDAAR